MNMSSMIRLGVGGVALLASAMATAHGARVGVVIGGPIWGPGWWYPPPYYYAPPTVVAVPTEPPQYIERETYAPAGAQAGYWYYCAATKTYYPYVKTCAEPWQQVTPQMPAQ